MMEAPFSVRSVDLPGDGGRELWVDDLGSSTRAQFQRSVAQAREACRSAGVGSGAMVIVPGEARLESLAWLFAVAGLGAVAAPLRRERLGELEAWKRCVRVDWSVGPAGILRVGEGATSEHASGLLGRLAGSGSPGLVLATGGTTGEPKLVLHDLAALLAAVPSRPGIAWRILPMMRFDHIGGLDIAWRALAAGQVLVAPPAETTPQAVAAAVERHRVQVLAATPSFLNLLLLAGAHEGRDLSSLRRVTYGAEPMPAGLLQRLRQALPSAVFVQRYGTSETGSVPAREGPGGLLLAPGEHGFSWRVEGGELWIRSPARALGYLGGSSDRLDSEGGWFRTGDLAEQSAEGALRILGRIEEVMNVGGEKVMPSEVEGVLIAHPDVADCRVFASASPVLGQIVCAEVVWGGAERDPLEVKNRLHAFAADRLDRHKLPVRVILVGAIDSTRNLKKLRVPSP